MIRETLEYGIPVYQSKNHTYIRTSDLQGYERLELERWVFGKVQPLIQGEEGAIIDAVFLYDYLEYLSYRKGDMAFVK